MERGDNWQAKAARTGRATNGCCGLKKSWQFQNTVSKRQFKKQICVEAIHVTGLESSGNYFLLTASCLCIQSFQKKPRNTCCKVLVSQYEAAPVRIPASLLWSVSLHVSAQLLSGVFVFIIKWPHRCMQNHVHHSVVYSATRNRCIVRSDNMHASA